MRILIFQMQGYNTLQFIENDAEAERLYAEAAGALADHETLPYKQRQTYEMVVSDGSRVTFRLADLRSVSLVIPDFPRWLKDYHVGMKRREGIVAREAAGWT